MPKRKDSELTSQLRADGFASIKAAKGTLLYGEKIKARNNYRNSKARFERQLLNKSRAAWFRSNNTMAFESHLVEGLAAEKSTVKVIQKYNLKERAALVTFIHQHDFKEPFTIRKSSTGDSR